MEYNRRLAKISKATLSMERDIMSFWIFVDYEEGGSQGVGGITLDNPKKEKQPDGRMEFIKRQGTAYGCEVIRRLLASLNVNDFSEMKGKYIWVLGEGEGLNFNPFGIQKPRNDLGDKEPVIFDDILMEFTNETDS
jgi:hypothetical protein|tara:strand:- start:80 stop:487 length:408 start_codon:yes stop_codon:yes gene_type:complete